MSSHLSGLTDVQVDKIKKHFSKDEKAITDKTENKKKKKVKLKEKNKQVEIKREKTKKKKKGRRTDFFVKKVESEVGTVVEEDGIKIIKMKGEMTLGEFAEKLKINSSEIIKKLFLKGQMLTINSPINIELAEEIADRKSVV